MRQVAVDALVVVAVAVVLAAFVTLSAFNWPSADDYLISNQLREHGLLGAQARWYADWTGRFFAMFCLTLYVKCVGIVEHYWLAPALLFAMMLGSLWWLLRGLPPVPQSKWRDLGSALVLMAVVHANVPEPQESIYWMTSIYSYQIGFVMAIVLLALLLRRPETRFGRTLNAIAAVTAALCAVGSSETLMAPVAALTGVWMVAAAMGRVPRTGRGVAVTVAVATGCAIVILAPGNEVRGTFFEGGHDLLRTLERSFAYGLGRFGVWSLSLSLLGAGLLFAPRLCSTGSSAIAREWAAIPHWCKVLGLALLLVTACAPVFWATGYGPPPRAIGLIWKVFALGWFAVVVPAGARFVGVRSWRCSRAQCVKAGKLLLAVGLLVQGTPGAVSDVLGGDGAAYYSESSRRHLEVRSARDAGQMSVALSPLQYRPASLFVADLSSNPNHWINLSFAEYYRLDRVTVEDEER